VRKIWVAVAVGFSLTGCAPLQIANLLFTAAGGVAQAVEPKMTFEAKQRIEPIDGQRVYAASFKGLRRGLRWISHCEAQAIVVDYEKDWDTVDEETGRIIRKAEIGKIHDQAILIYKLTCKEEDPRKILLTSDRKEKLWYLKKVKLHREEFIITNNYFNFSEKDRPRWMAQVIKTIQEEAVQNPAAQDFLDNVEIKDGLPFKEKPA